MQVRGYIGSSTPSVKKISRNSAEDVMCATPREPGKKQQHRAASANAVHQRKKGPTQVEPSPP